MPFGKYWDISTFGDPPGLDPELTDTLLAIALTLDIWYWFNAVIASVKITSAYRAISRFFDFFFFIFLLGQEFPANYLLTSSKKQHITLCLKLVSSPPSL